jgi:23S rRNA (cytidine2498-2'-O)-methyltransferase
VTGVRARALYLTTPGFEAALVSELGEAAATHEIDRPGVVVVRWADEGDGSDGGDPARAVGRDDRIGADDRSAGAAAADAIRDPVFSRQHLPAALELSAPSVGKLADAIYAAAADAVDRAAAGPASPASALTLHVVLPPGIDPGLGSRAGLLGREVTARFEDRRRRAWRRFVPPEDARLVWSEVDLLIQVLVVERERAWLSLARPRPLPWGGTDLAPWPGGTVVVPDDRHPPSRAYRKLEEAFAWMGRHPGAGELCVDLGASPGGWTYTALKHGARVVAVDRAPLLGAVGRHPAVRMVEGNAFTFSPGETGLGPKGEIRPGRLGRPTLAAPADWLLSDVICEPRRSLGLIERWLGAGWCKHLIVTIKFKGTGGYGILAEVRAALRQAGCPRFRIKHLHHNKNEVTVMASAP